MEAKGLSELIYFELFGEKAGLTASVESSVRQGMCDYLSSRGVDEQDISKERLLRREKYRFSGASVEELVAFFNQYGLRQRINSVCHQSLLLAKKRLSDNLLSPVDDCSNLMKRYMDLAEQLAGDERYRDWMAYRTKIVHNMLDYACGATELIDIDVIEDRCNFSE